MTVMRAVEPCLRALRDSLMEGLVHAFHGSNQAPAYHLARQQHLVRPANVIGGGALGAAMYIGEGVEGLEVGWIGAAMRVKIKGSLM